ncbi:hypothetical protein TNCV_4144471 [Trichonephila clavipes]|nr:hypothetical protein TNCV_4144471 [Trichonephila clavipes]
MSASSPNPLTSATSGSQQNDIFQEVKQWFSIQFAEYYNDDSKRSNNEKETPNSTTLSKKIAQGNLTASCKRLISWFLLYKGTELGHKIVPVRPPKF